MLTYKVLSQTFNGIITLCFYNHPQRKIALFSVDRKETDLEILINLTIVNYCMIFKNNLHIEMHWKVIPLFSQVSKVQVLSVVL